MNNQPSSPKFEDVYPRYEFAPLVRLSIGLGEWISRNLLKDIRRASVARAGDAAGAQQ